MSDAQARSPFDLSGRVAVVTGASRGIGAAIAEGLALAGADVFGLSRTGTGPMNSRVVHRRCDICDGASRSDFFETLFDRGGFHILVNAAGISLPPGTDEASELKRLRATFEVNLVGAYAVILAARPLLRQTGKGSIINVTSINSLRGFPSNPGYVASKAALAGLTRAAAVDLARDGIRVNALAPGYVHTDMTAHSYADPILHAQRRQQTILGRWGQPSDLSGAAVFLASDASAYVTGQELIVDGGWTVNGLVHVDGRT